MKTLANGKRLARRDANRINLTYKVAWDAVFTHLDNDPDMEGFDCGRIASAAAMAAQDVMVDLLAVDA